MGIASYYSMYDWLSDGAHGSSQRNIWEDLILDIEVVMGRTSQFLSTFLPSSMNIMVIVIDEYYGEY